MEEHMAGNQNSVWMTGHVQQPPVFSHRVGEKAFYTFPFVVERLSGREDILPVVLPEELLTEECAEGCCFRLGGALRSRNVRQDGRYRLLLNVLGRTFTANSDEGCPTENLVSLSGTICKTPIYRETPLGRTVCDLMLAVRRPYGRADFLPLIAWGRSAAVAGELSIGAQIAVSGRFQSREYRKAEGDSFITKTAYEVSVAELMLPGEF